MYFDFDANNLAAKSDIKTLILYTLKHISAQLKQKNQKLWIAFFL